MPKTAWLWDFFISANSGGVTGYTTATCRALEYTTTMTGCETEYTKKNCGAIEYKKQVVVPHNIQQLAVLPNTQQQHKMVLYNIQQLVSYRI